MVGLLSGRLFLLGKEENIIKAKKEGEQDSKYFRLTFGDGGRNVFSVTCGSKAWEQEVAPGKKVLFDPYSLAFGQQYDVTFDVDTSSGYNKLKLRTWKTVGSISQASNPEKK
jgi:hypothetical protein